jgi:hypothetical protein
MKQRIIILFAILCTACGVQKPLTEEQYTQAIRKDVPFGVAEFKVVKPDVYSFRCDEDTGLLPDYEVDNEGASIVWRTTFAPTHDKQPTSVIWRNIVVNKKQCRILCIDRLLRDGKTFGYVYVLQGETKAIPNGYHWDVTDHRLMMNVAPILEAQAELSVELLRVTNPLQQ